MRIMVAKKKTISKTQSKNKSEDKDKSKSKKNAKKAQTKSVVVALDDERLKELCDECVRWQRKMDPSNFNKSRGAQYHTAPTVLTPNDIGFPDDLPLEAITFLFRISDEGWIGTPEKMTVENPLVVEKEPRRGAKNGPVFILSETAALCTVAYKDNYYWSANVLSKHQVLRITFVPEKARIDGKKRNIVVYATFLPNEDD